MAKQAFVVKGITARGFVRIIYGDALVELEKQSDRAVFFLVK
jgi:hypothetical protein